MFARTSHLLALVTLAASIAAATLFISSQGCTVLTNDEPLDDAGEFEGGDATAATCNVCLAAACLAPASLCLADDGCAAIVDCSGDAGCVCNASSDGGPLPDRLHHAYTACFDARVASCAIECEVDHPAPLTLAACVTPDAGPTDAGADAAAPFDAGTTGAAPGPDACIACAAQTCAGAVAACNTGSECEAFLACSSACTTSSCVTDCGTLHATGKVAAAELATCTATNCQNDCEL